MTDRPEATSPPDATKRMAKVLGAEFVLNEATSLPGDDELVARLQEDVLWLRRYNDHNMQRTANRIEAIIEALSRKGRGE